VSRFSEIIESISFAYKSIVANKLRSLLATLGIVIGISAVTLMQTAIEGINRAFESSISSIGADLLYVQKFEWFGNEDWSVYRNRKDIDFRQFNFLKKNLQSAVGMSASIGSPQTLKYRDLMLQNVLVYGTDAEYQFVTGSNMESGRFFTTREATGGYPVCVIGMDIKEAFFPNSDPLEKNIKIANQTYRIIGVLEKQGSMLGLFSLDNQVLIPIERYIQYISGWNTSLSITVKAANVDKLEETKDEIISIMRKVRKVPYGERNDFGVNQQELFKSTYDQLTSLIKIIGTLITLMALIVGSIGIANIMFVSVKERTKEIGVRKALGAKRSSILMQFLIESSVVCLLGGFIGLLISFPVSLIIDALVLPTVMPIWVIVLALFISLFFGVLAGFFPALKASKLDPVDSLRYE